MKRPRVLSVRFVVFSLAPTLFLLLGAEIAVRLKYFFAPGHDVRYLVAPIGRGSVFASAQSSAGRSGTKAGVAIPDTTLPAGEGSAEQADQLVFQWQTPCVDRMVYSAELRKEMPRTWDEHCFRGDRVKTQKEAGEYRIVFLGGSTVEDAQSDTEMMTAQFKGALAASYRGKRLTVVNAGRANFDSRVIHSYWRSVVHDLSPDLVLYYEAWNEQQGDIKFTGMTLNQRIDAFGRYWLHRTLYYRSMLYTYLVERFGFRMISGERFWKIDVKQLHHFTELAREVRGTSARFAFVTQVVRFPRMWKGVDTFDYHAVDALLDRLKADRRYSYDVTEISALNQRLAVSYTIDLCRQNAIPVVNILDAIERLGDTGRAELFSDLGHLTVKGDRMVGRLIAAGLSPVN